MKVTKRLKPIFLVFILFLVVTQKSEAQTDVISSEALQNIKASGNYACHNDRADNLNRAFKNLSEGDLRINARYDQDFIIESGKTESTTYGNGNFTCKFKAKKRQKQSITIQNGTSFQIAHVAIKRRVGAVWMMGHTDVYRYDVNFKVEHDLIDKIQCYAEDFYDDLNVSRLLGIMTNTGGEYANVSASLSKNLKERIFNMEDCYDIENGTIDQIVERRKERQALAARQEQEKMNLITYFALNDSKTVNENLSKCRLPTFSDGTHYSDYYSSKARNYPHLGIRLKDYEQTANLIVNGKCDILVAVPEVTKSEMDQALAAEDKIIDFIIPKWRPAINETLDGCKYLIGEYKIIIGGQTHHDLNHARTRGLLIDGIKTGECKIKGLLQ